jgi:hypothetical protein
LVLSLEVGLSLSWLNRGRSLGRLDPWLPPREDCGPRLPPWSVAMRRLIAVKRRRMRVRTMHHCERLVYRKKQKRRSKTNGWGDWDIPFDETPAPISMSGSSTIMPDSIGRPPVPPYSAVSIHFRSASVRRSIGMTLTPV